MRRPAAGRGRGVGRGPGVTVSGARDPSGVGAALVSPARCDRRHLRPEQATRQGTTPAGDGFMWLSCVIFTLTAHERCAGVDAVGLTKTYGKLTASTGSAFSRPG